MTNKILHYSLTPVQSFVSQARRTRDLWAGSYLLSYLVGRAIVSNDSEKVTFPDISSDPLIKIINNTANEEEAFLASRLGSLPNRFTALLPEDKQHNYTNDIEQNWKKVSDTVKKGLKNKGLVFDERLENLWNKQIENLWEHQWIIGTESYLLDQRKNLRNHYKTPEKGEKCTVCGEREELSDCQEPNPSKMNQWWDDNIRPRLHQLDLRKNERLCAVCLIKRLFPKVSKEAIGWDVPQFYPSTAYLSAIDWICNILEKAKEDEKLATAIKDFTKIAQDVLYRPQEKAERYTFIQQIHDLITEYNNLDFTAFADLDGDVFYLSSIIQTNYELKDDTRRKELIKALKKLYKAAGSEPSPFYAILFMDGDGMGALLSNKTPDEKSQISEALSSFTQQVPNIVRKYNGVLTYAGGDDVFALLPVSKAMECATECRKKYLEAFQIIENIVGEKTATISAAIEYVHMNTALGVVVKDSHSLLDDIAKDKTGRDAIACRVWKRGGAILTWAQPWQLDDHPMLITNLFNDTFTKFHGNQPEKFSSKLLYKLRDLLELVQAGENSPFAYNDIKELLITEHIANREYDEKAYERLSTQEKRNRAEKQIDQLLQLCRHHIRDENGNIKTLDKYSADAALLIRFLSQKEV